MRLHCSIDVASSPNAHAGQRVWLCLSLAYSNFYCNDLALSHSVSLFCSELEVRS